MLHDYSFIRWGSLVTLQSVNKRLTSWTLPTKIYVFWPNSTLFQSLKLTLTLTPSRVNQCKKWLNTWARDQIKLSIFFRWQQNVFILGSCNLLAGQQIADDLAVQLLKNSGDKILQNTYIFAARLHNNI